MWYLISSKYQNLKYSILVKKLVLLLLAVLFYAATTSEVVCVVVFAFETFLVLEVTLFTCLVSDNIRSIPRYSPFSIGWID